MINSLKQGGKKLKIIVMIPAYNEAANIGRVIKGVPRKINGIAEVEVMVMDDHSSDETSLVAKEAGAEYVFRQKQNVGLGINFKKGIDIALKLGADIIVNIDGDGQFNPKDIEKLVRPILHQEADMVTCSRFLNPEMTKNMPWSKKWGNKRFTNLISRITGEKFTDTQCGFRAYSREAALRLNLKGKFTYTQEVFIDLVEKGMRIKEVPCEVRYFDGRKSAISDGGFAGLVKGYGFKSLGIIAKATRDTQPLTFFGFPAAVIFAFGFLGGLFSFVYWLFYHATTPVRTLFNVSVFFMVFGLALGILALIADMLKTIKTSHDEILYRLKRNEVDTDKMFQKINGRIEKVNGDVRKMNGDVEKINGNVEKVNGAVKRINGHVEEIRNGHGKENVEMFGGDDSNSSEEKKSGYYAGLKKHQERMRGR
jgi:glycosyltransferase involved in cell wall biosynthesis